MGTFLEPDLLYGIAEDFGLDDIYTFLYDRDVGLLVGAGDLVHGQLIDRLDKEETKEICQALHQQYSYARHPAPEERALLGRCGPMAYITQYQHDNYVNNIIREIRAAISGPIEDYCLISFWQKPGPIWELFPDTMAALHEGGYVWDRCVVSAPSTGTQEYNPTKSINHDITPGGMSDEQLAKMRQLHLMRGDEKKKAMAELGLTTSSQKRPIQAALEKGGYITPGHKWWAPHSESLFSHKLNLILDRFDT